MPEIKDEEAYAEAAEALSKPKRARASRKPKAAAEDAAAEAGPEGTAPAKPKRARASRKVKAEPEEPDNTSTLNSDVGTMMTGAPGSVKKKAQSAASDGSVEAAEAAAGEEIGPKPKRERKKKRGDPGMPPAFGEALSPLSSWCCSLQCSCRMFWTHA